MTEPVGVPEYPGAQATHAQVVPDHVFVKQGVM